MNIALLAKLGWRLITEKDSLWATVLRKKFRVKDDNSQEWMMSKNTWSPTWRSLMLGFREVVLPGLSWVIGDGGRVRFWLDRWLLNEPLMKIAIDVVPEELINLTVRDFWRNGTGWLLQRIESYVSQDTRLQLSSVVIDDITGAFDRLSWGESKDGIFTVKSAYAMYTRNTQPRPNMKALFDRIWRVVVPERVRVFLWLVANSAIMTNLEWKRRHLCDDGFCSVCKGGEESILHVLRDCPSTLGIWNRVVSRSRQRAFFQLPLLEWLFENLALDVPGQDDSWSTLFALVIWWSWKWRCGYVFGAVGRCRDRVSFVKNLALEVIKANSTLKMRQTAGTRVEQQISWTRPSPGWFKLNTDGASKGNPGLAAAGGVLRDEYGTWCGGFALHIGICSAPLAELWGVYYGLCIAWDRRISCLELEVDSEIVVGFLRTGINASHPLSFLVQLCYGFLSRDWSVKISHVYREANYLADGLANHAFSLPLGLHLFDVVPESVVSFMLEDANGVARPRHVRL